MWQKIKSHQYVQGTLEASGTVYNAFRKRRKQLIKLSLLSAFLTFCSLGIVGTQLFYPFHMIIGLGVYILSFVPFVRRVYLSRKTWQEYHAYKLTAGFVKKERRRFYLAGVVLVLVAVFFWLRPLDGNPFAGMSDEQIVTLVSDDLYRSVSAIDYLETTGNELLTVLLDDAHDTNQTEAITTAFATFLDAVSYSESLTEVHRYFASIPYSEWDTRVESFLIANSLYAKKYEIVHRMIVAVDGDEFEQKALNQYLPSVGYDTIYNEMAARYLEPKTRVRLIGGYVYQLLFVQNGDETDVSYQLLRDKAYGSFAYLRANTIVTALHAPEVLSDRLEQKMFEAWFPTQKGVATAMGRVILSTRGKAGLITAEQAREMGVYMEPGDIMLQRRNWHVSNVGIPGFWTHAALYTGTLSELDQYFVSEFPYEGANTFSDYVATHMPAVYARYAEIDESGDQPAVLEAIEPGVVAQTLPVSTDADFVVVLRGATLTKQDKMLALIKAFANFGKPYDFNFDFETRDAMVCSELVYDAYYERPPEKQGIHIDTSLVNGRPIVSPLDIATKFVHEHGTVDAELQFIYFLRGDEATGSAFVSDEAAFLDSVNWSKFSFLQAGRE